MQSKNTLMTQARPLCSPSLSIAFCLPESCFYSLARESSYRLHVLECTCTHVPESLDLRACIHLAPPGPQTPAPVTAPLPRTGALAQVRVPAQQILWCACHCTGALVQTRCTEGPW